MNAKKKLIVSISICFIIAGSVFSQTESKEYTKFDLSGFKVTIVYSDTFAIKMDESIQTEKKVKGEVVSFNVVDQRGKRPKSTMTIHTNKLEYLSLQNCELDMRTPFKADSLVLVAGPSSGKINVKAKYLSVNIGGGSNYKISGTADFFDCAVGAGSSLDASSLEADKGNIDVRGHCSAKVNIREVLNQFIENAKVNNTYK